MIAAGVPLIGALEMVARNPSIRVSHKTISGLIQHLKSGLTFSESMKRVHGWMPEFDIALLSVGEQTGRLDVSFKTLSSYYATRAAIIRDTIMGLLTTIATLHVFLLVFPIALLQAFAMGILNSNYSQCIPFLVEKAVVFGGGYLGVFLLIYACQGKHGEGWRSIVESVADLIPMLRTARRYLILSRLSASLEALTRFGMSIVNGWELASHASGSPHLRRTISEWKSPLESGVTPAELVSQTCYFPEMFTNLYTTGEISGQLDDTLHRLQVFYQEEGFRKLRLFTRIMNGTIYGLLVLLVALNVIRFYIGYYGGMIQSI